MNASLVEAAARRLRDAAEAGVPCSPGSAGGTSWRGFVAYR